MLIQIIIGVTVGIRAADYLRTVDLMKLGKKAVAKVGAGGKALSEKLESVKPVDDSPLKDGELS